MARAMNVQYQKGVNEMKYVRCEKTVHKELNERCSIYRASPRTPESPCHQKMDKVLSLQASYSPHPQSLIEVLRV
jgi:hypothetical protein